MMTKRDFVALADAIRENFDERTLNAASGRQMAWLMADALVRFCRTQNSRFDETRWRDYLAGKRGPNGGSRIKPKKGDSNAIP